MIKRMMPGKDGNKYVPYNDRSGGESVVFFTRDLSEEGLKKIYDKVASVLEGRVAVKLHTGEAEGPNILPRPWVKELFSERLPDATIVETNTYYEGDRYTTEQHRKTLEINGWTFCPVDITDEEGVAALPVNGGKAMIERVETRHGLRQLSYMKELGMGNDRYKLIDIDNGDAEITAAEAVKDIEPVWKPDIYNVFWGRNKRNAK